MKMNILRRLKFLLILLIMAPDGLPAASSRFIRMSQLESLFNSSVFSIYQDELGAMWLNTNYGLFRFNGSSLDFLQEPLPMRPICGNGADLIYAASSDAIYCYSTRKNLPQALHAAQLDCPNCAMYAEDEQLWVGSGNRLYTRQQDSLCIAHRLPAEDAAITAITRSAQGDLLVATNSHGVYTIAASGHISNLTSTIGNITALYVDHMGAIWVGTIDQGCYRLGATGTLSAHYHRDATPQMRLKSNLVRTFCEDRDGDVWIGTMTGINRLDASRRVCADKTPALDDCSVWSLCADNQGGIWAGTFYDGVYYCNSDNYPFTSISLPEKREIRLINAMVEDKHGDVWILTDRFGMFRLSGRDGRIKFIEGSANHKFKSAWYDPAADAIWTGSYMGTLRKYTIADGLWTDYPFLRADGSEYHETVNDIKPYAGELYLGTAHGVLVFDGRSRKILQKRLEGYDGIVFSLAVDNNNRLWIGGGGVYMHDLKTRQTTPYKSKQKNAYNPRLNFIKLFCDHNNCIWGASLGQGFMRLDQTNEMQYTRENVGLADNFTSFIGEIGNDLLLIGTNSGLTLFDTRTNRCYNYNRANGLGINSARSGCVLKRTNGDVVIGGVDGMEYVASSQIDFSDDDIDIAFDKLVINNRSVHVDERLFGNRSILQEELPYTPKITLNYRQRNLSVKMASFDFAKVYPIFYEYRLEGYDSEWTPFSADRPITYMNLPPNDYRLRVRATHNKFDGNYKEIALEIKIRAAWYATIWAKALYYVVAIALIGWLLSAFYSRMLLKERLKQKEVENLERMRFFIQISHELRTPLTLIIGQLELFLRNHKGEPTPDENIESTYRNAQRMQQIVSNLLDFEKQHQGYTNITITDTNICTFMGEIKDSFAQYANYRNIALNLHTPAGSISPCIDKEQIRSVFSNLLINAFKYTPDGGRIDITIRTVGRGKENRSVKITFADTGCGISESALPHIFDPFYQDAGHTSYDRHNQGTGIGLALSRGIVELHHGTLTAENAPLGGALFCVQLPLGADWYMEDGKVIRTEQQSTPEDTQAQKVETSIIPQKTSSEQTFAPTYKMLIVEDDADLRMLLCSIFKRSYRISEASDGAEGYTLAKNMQPDIIISDVVMPVMDGLSLCAKLRQDFETCHISIILLTAQPSANHGIDGINQGADDYITKPFNIDQLEARCSNLLANRRRLRNKYSRSITAPDEVTTNDKDARFLASVTETVEKNLYNDDLGVQTLCRELNMGKTILTQKLKGITGCSPGEFIEMIRFKKAAALLCLGEQSVSEISYELGFSSPKYFTIRFKKQFGQTPTQFQQEHQVQTSIEAGA